MYLWKNFKVIPSSLKQILTRLDTGNCDFSDAQKSVRIPTFLLLDLMVTQLFQKQWQNVCYWFLYLKSPHKLFNLTSSKCRTNLPTTDRRRLDFSHRTRLQPIYC